MTEVVIAPPRTPGWLTRLIRLPNVFVEPSEIFDWEAREPDALVPLLVVSVGLAILLMAYSGLMVKIALSALPAAQRAEVTPSVSAMVDQNKWIGAALVPVYVCASALVAGLLIFSVASATAPVRHTENGGLHRAVSIAAYASLAILLEEFLTYVALRVIGFDNLQYFWDLKPLPGLHYLVLNPDTHRVAFAVLERLNFFTLAYGFLIAYGTRRVFRTSRLAAATAAVLVVSSGLLAIALLAWVKS